MIRKAFIISLLLHIILIFLIFYLAKKEIIPQKEIFYADLIRPDEGVLKKDEKQIIEPPPSKPQRPSKSSPRQRSLSPLTEKTYKQDILKNEKPSIKDGNDIAKSEKRTEPSNEQILPPKPPSTPSDEGTRRLMKDTKTFKERIFDQDVIKEIAKADKPTLEKDGTITFDTREFKYHGYLKKLRQRIESAWKYPQEAAERGIYGDLYIKFTINKNGSIGPIELLRTSGHSILDNAAMKAIREAAPYWPVPDELGKDSFTITGHFVYSIYGTYIR